MRYTNKYNLPDIVYRALTFREAYEPGEKTDISLTALIDSPQVRLLRKRHWQELEEDIMDRVWAVFGTAIHDIFRRAVPPDKENEYLNERKLLVTLNGWKIGFKLDYFHIPTGEIKDYKFTSAWNFIFGDKKSWERQDNIYKVALEAHGYKVTSLQNIAILRDWSENEYRRNPQDYPETKVIVRDIPIYPSQVVVEYMMKQIVKHQQAEKFPDAELPECTPEEKWARPASYAVMKPSGGRALRVFTDGKAYPQEAGTNNPITIQTAKALAEQRARESGGGAYAEFRAGENYRCNNMCPVKEFCFQRKREMIKPAY